MNNNNNDNQSLDANLQHRILDMYENILHYNFLNYAQTNNIMRQLEISIYNLMIRGPRNTNSEDTNTSIPHFNIHSSNEPNDSIYDNLHSYYRQSQNHNTQNRNNRNNRSNSQNRTRRTSNRNESTEHRTNANSRNRSTNGNQININTSTNASTNASTNTNNRPVLFPMAANNGLSISPRTPATIRLPSGIRTPFDSRSPTNPFNNNDLNEFYTTLFPNIFNPDLLTPVVVRPTRREINNATELITFNENMTHNICPITQSHFQENETIRRIKHCGHCFTNEELNRWFLRSVFCPVCRYDIREYSQNFPSTSGIHNSSFSFFNDLSNNIFPFNSDLSNNFYPFNTDISNNNFSFNTDLSYNHVSFNNDLSNNSSNIDTTVPINTTHSNTNSTPITNMEDLLSTFSSQISNQLTQTLANTDISMNELDNRGINFEYTIQTPNNMTYTFTSNSVTSLGDIARNINSVAPFNTNDNNNDNDNNDNDNDNDN